MRTQHYVATVRHSTGRLIEFHYVSSQDDAKARFQRSYGYWPDDTDIISLTKMGATNSDHAG